MGYAGTTWTRTARNKSEWHLYEEGLHLTLDDCTQSLNDDDDVKAIKRCMDRVK